MREMNCAAVCVPASSFLSLGRWDRAAGFGQCLCSRRRLHQDEAKAHKLKRVLAQTKRQRFNHGRSLLSEQWDLRAIHDLIDLIFPVCAYD